MLLFNMHNFNESIRNQEWTGENKQSIFKNIRNTVQDNKENLLDSLYYFLKNYSIKGYSINTSFYFTNFLTGLINYEFDNGITCNLDSKFEDYQIYLNINKDYTRDKELKTSFGISLHLIGLTLVGNNNLHSFFSSKDSSETFTKVKHWCLLGLRTTNKGTLMSAGTDKNSNTEILEFSKSIEYHIVNNPLIFYFNVNKHINEKYNACLRIEITTGDVYYKYSPLKGYLHIPGARICFGIDYKLKNDYLLNFCLLLGFREILPLIKNIFKDYNFSLGSFIVYGLCLKVYK